MTPDFPGPGAASPDSPAPLPISIVGRARAYAGYLFGCRQPVLRLGLRIGHFDEARWPQIDSLMRRALGLRADSGPTGLNATTPQRIAQWVAALEEKAGMPIFEVGRQRPVSAAEPGLFVMIQPCLDPQTCGEAFALVVRMANQEQMSGEAARDDINALLQRMQRRAPRGFNSIHFLRAAHELGIPWARVIGNVYQFGWGAQSHWLSSSFTESTSRISAQLARDKQLTASLLRASGLPVPQHLSASTQDDAVRAAETIGFPVVVKPADTDGGRGVAAHLKSASSVRKAFDDAQQHSKRVLVEKHVAGRDYRLQVVGAEVQGVLERVPGGVSGNGVDAVSALLAQQNHDRDTASDDRRYLKSMALDDEALALLAEHVMTADSVPMAGQFVRLRSAANVASGGVPVPVALATVHEDNLVLAIRAAQALRLDVAGIDLLMPDITRSWREVGGAICEVNAQPQMFSTMHAPMLQKLVGAGQGRIPTVVVLGDESGATLGVALQRALTARGWATGLVSAEEISIGVQRIYGRSTNAYLGGLMLLRDRTVQALVISIDGLQMLEQGWPIDRCDVLVLAAPTAAQGQADAALTAHARSLRPAKVIVDARSARHLAQTYASFGDGGSVQPVGPTDEAAPLPVQALVDATLNALRLSSGPP